MTALNELLAPWGAPPDSVVELRGEPDPRHARYPDLRAAVRRLPLVPHGVVELRDGPLAYVFDSTEEELDDEAAGRLCHLLAYRGDAPYLTVVRPGQLTVYGIALDLRQNRNRILQRRADVGTFHELHLRPPGRDPQRKAAQQILFDLFTQAVEGLVEAQVPNDDAISLAGRALFARFLIDRGLFGSSELAAACPTAEDPERLFSNARNAEATCAWLERTFNGDFLPLDAVDFHRLGDQAFWHLDNVLHRSPGGQLSFNWDAIDFSYVPVEVLSQVYEWSAARWSPGLRDQQSMYFTPLRIARAMVREVFTALDESGPVPPHQARILDPAVGGGVFLVAAFREICAAWWRHHGRPPKTQEIRSILTRQLMGFDIHEPALRLAALGLYLTAIELDQEPRPVEKLRFSPLRGTVLYNRRPSRESAEQLTAGSLAELEDSRFGRYDVVLGNPPWTSLNDGEADDKDRAREVHAAMVESVRPVVVERLGDERAARFEIPDMVPDLPFVWAAMRWARPSGWIAFALHARLLFKQSDAGRAAREDLFEALDVTGVLNGGALRQTAVWPKVGAPFCLLFACNRPTTAQSAFYFASPYLERPLNRQGRLRVDARAAYPVASAQVATQPNLLKTLFRGTLLDAAVLDSLRKNEVIEFSNYWQNQLHLATGVGYQIKGDANDASFLKGLGNLDAQSKPGYLVDIKNLPLFSRDTLHRPRKKEIYLGPLLLVRKSPPAGKEVRAHVCFSNLAYTESFYGYSASDAENGQLLVRYLALVLHSDLFLWHTLVTSGEFGVERESIYKIDIDRFPIVPLAVLPSGKSQEIVRMSDELFAGRSDWKEINEWVGYIYSLDRWDQEVIEDTLAVGLPFVNERRNAERPPKATEVAAFTRRIQEDLAPFAAPQRITLQALGADSVSPWEVLVIDLKDQLSPQNLSEADLASLFAHADALGASQIVLPSVGRLRVAILRQFRYWTPTRARLLALEILEEHLEIFLGSDSNIH